MKFKHLRPRILALAAALAVAGAGGIASIASGSPNADVVFGSGEITGCISPGPCTLPNRPFTVNAVSKKATKAHGTYSFGLSSSATWIRGKVTCVNVEGNLASVGGIIKKSGSSLADGEYFVVYFVDNGPPVNGVSPDLASRPDISPETNPAETLPADFPDSCPDPVSPISYYPLLAGDVIVQDATA